VKVLILIYYFVLLVTAVMGIVAAIRKKSGLHIKLLAYIVVFVFIAEISNRYWLYGILHRPNLQAYNFVFLVEPMVYALYFLQIIRQSTVRKLIIGFLCLFPLFWFFTVYFIFQFTEWNSYVLVVGGFFTVLWSVAYLYEIITFETHIRLQNHSEFWVSVGLLIFYVCNIPLMGMYNFILTHFPKISYSIIPINLSANIIMYSLFTYAFICKLMTNTEKS
jgi:hypothetical protein